MDVFDNNDAMSLFLDAENFTTNLNLTEVLHFPMESTANETFNNSININSSTPAVPVCVLCLYKLPIWLKTLRVGFGGVIVLSNLLVFTCLLKAKGLPMSLRYFLINVSIVDFFYGFGFLYHSAIVDFPAFIKMNLECKLRYAMLCMVSMVAMFTLTAMCVERVISLRFAFSDLCPKGTCWSPWRCYGLCLVLPAYVFIYRRLVTKRNVLVAMAVFWIVPLCLVLPAYVFMDQDIGECNFIRFIVTRSFLVFALVYFIFMIVAVISQLILYFIAQRHIKKIVATLVGSEKERAAFNMNVKATSTTLAMAVPFVVCATPKILTYMYLAFQPAERLRVESLTMLAVTIYLNVSNSLANPFIYWWRLQQVRDQLPKVCRFKSDLDSSSGSGKDTPDRSL